jgi:hypothetical protein
MLMKHRTLSGSVPSLLLKHGDQSGGGGDYLELYTTVDLRANYFLSERVSLVGVFPVVNRYRSIDKKRVADTYGIGDPIIAVNYILHNSLSDTEGWATRITGGLGVKAPAGRTDVTYEEQLLDRDMQAGTGSWDPLLSVSLVARKGKVGVGCQWIGMLSTEGGQGERYGHNQNLNLEAFYLAGGEKLSVAPAIGMYGENYGNESIAGEQIAGTGGSVLFAKAGVRAWNGAWQLQTELQYAVAEERAETVPPNKFRVIAGLSYYL